MEEGGNRMKNEKENIGQIIILILNFIDGPYIYFISN